MVDVFTQDHSFEYAYSPYRRIREYAGDDDLDNLPGFLQLLLNGMNSSLEALGLRAFNQAEMNILLTLTVQQVISYYTFIIAADDISDKALAETFHNTPEDNGFANAFRHVYLSYIATKNLGLPIASDLLNAHEEGQIGDNSSIMDDKNNAIGKGIANGCCPRTNFSDANIAYQTLLNMAINGQLWTLQNPGDRYSAVGLFPYIPPTNGGPTQGIP